MTQTTISSPKQQYSFLQAQLQKINAAVLQHQQSIFDLQQSQAVIVQQAKKIFEMQKKIKLIEVYQHQNFNNNQRLFHSQTKLDMLEKKVEMLEVDSLRNNQKHHQASMLKNDTTQEDIKRLDLRIGEIEEELRRFRLKNNVIAKFRRQLSPANNNCESTKDISGEGKNDIKALQKKLKQYINMKISDLQAESVQKLATMTTNNDKQENQLLSLNRKTRLKRSPSCTDACGETAFKKRIDNYYNQVTEPGEKWFEYGQGIEEPKERQREEKKGKKRTKQRKDNIKEVKSQSKSSRKGSKSKRSVRSSDKINLISVNEYMRLRKYVPL